MRLEFNGLNENGVNRPPAPFQREWVGIVPFCCHSVFMFAHPPACVEEQLAMSVADRQTSNRSASVVGFSDTDLVAIQHHIERTGARVLRAATVGEAVRFADVIVANALDERDLEDALATVSDAKTLVVRASLQTVDAVVEHWPDADVVIGSDPVELHLALATALVRGITPAAMFDVASEEGLRLQRLADEIGRIARSLIDLPEGLSGHGGVGDRSMDYRSAPSANVSPDTGAIAAAEVRAIIRLRRLRDRYFPGELFADPAWDMLLDLAAARIERTRVAVSSLCIAAAVPPTTALRWIKAMTDKGLLQRVADPHDARRIFIQLSDDASLAMERYLRMARDTSGLAI